MVVDYRSKGTHSTVGCRQRTLPAKPPAALSLALWSVLTAPPPPEAELPLWPEAATPSHIVRLSEGACLPDGALQRPRDSFPGAGPRGEVSPVPRCAGSVLLTRPLVPHVRTAWPVLSSLWRSDGDFPFPSACACIT